MKNTELPSYTKALPSFFKCVFRKCEVLIQCLQSFPFKITYWTVVSVFKGSSTKFQYYIYKFKEFSRKKSISRSFQGPSSFLGVFQARANHMSWISVFTIEIRTNYRNENFALRLALNEGLWGTPKWIFHWSMYWRVKPEHNKLLFEMWNNFKWSSKSLYFAT